MINVDKHEYLKMAVHTVYRKEKTRRPILSEYEIASLKLIIAYQNLQLNVLNVPFDWKSRAYRASWWLWNVNQNEYKAKQFVYNVRTTKFPLDMHTEFSALSHLYMGYL